MSKFEIYVEKDVENFVFIERFGHQDKSNAQKMSFALWDNFVVFTVKQKVFRTTAFLFCFAEF